MVAFIWFSNRLLKKKRVKTHCPRSFLPGDGSRARGPSPFLRRPPPHNLCVVSCPPTRKDAGIPVSLVCTWVMLLYVVTRVASLSAASCSKRRAKSSPLCRWRNQRMVLLLPPARWGQWMGKFCARRRQTPCCPGHLASAARNVQPRSLPKLENLLACVPQSDDSFSHFHEIILASFYLAEHSPFIHEQLPQPSRKKIGANPKCTLWNRPLA